MQRLSFCPQGGVGIWQTPPGQTPPWADAPFGRTPPHLGRHPPGQTPPGRHTIPLGRHLPRADPPPPDRRLLQRTACILLECILVLIGNTNLFQWFRIARHAFFGSAINMLWLFGLTLCGPFRYSICTFNDEACLLHSK